MHQVSDEGRISFLDYFIVQLCSVKECKVFGDSESID